MNCQRRADGHETEMTLSLPTRLHDRLHGPGRTRVIGDQRLRTTAPTAYRGCGQDIYYLDHTNHALPVKYDRDRQRHVYYGPGPKLLLPHSLPPSPPHTFIVPSSKCLPHLWQSPFP
jgi:hypothetical protein